MKKCRTKQGGTAAKAAKAADAIDRQPWATIAFSIIVAAIIAILMLTYNSVVPAYQ